MAWASKRGARPKTRSSTGLPSITEEGCIRPWATRAPWRSRKIGVASKRHWWHKSGAMGGVARGQGQSLDELKKLVVQLLVRVSALEEEIQRLRGERPAEGSAEET